MTFVKVRSNKKYHRNVSDLLEYCTTKFINAHDLLRAADASAPEEVYFPPGVVTGHIADNRRHRPAARVSG